MCRAISPDTWGLRTLPIKLTTPRNVSEARNLNLLIKNLQRAMLSKFKNLAKCYVEQVSDRKGQFPEV